MNAGRDRPGRKDHRRCARTDGRRARPRGRWLALLLIGATLALGAAPAQAETGGASAFAATGLAPGGGGLAFSSMRSAGATWYGPGLYGNRTACGQTLQPHTIGVAHRTLPCGTAVKFAHNSRLLVARVIDRGPFAAGVAWDLTNGARRLLGFEGVGRIRYAVALRLARR